ncbi:MAG: histidine kinase dimerization/phospho-acceptor domain-containing protein [Bacteroidia bacterium]
MGALQAARPYTPVFVNPLTEQWRWKHFPELDGKGVRFIAEATDQRVWAGCNEGVFEYDGYSWKAHNAQNGLDASPVEVLFEASDGGIFALAPQGIYRYDGTHWHPFFTVPDKVSFTFYEIRQLKDGSLVVVTDQGMIHFTERDNYQFFSSKIRIERLKNYFPKAKWIELPESALSPEGDLLRITDILESGTGEIWMAITVQMEIGKLLILRLSDIVDGAIQKYKVVETAAGFPLGESQKLLEANDKKIWVVNTTSNRGISIFDGKKWESVRLSEKFGGDEYMSGIFQSENGRIWISAMAKVFTWEKGIWQVYESPEYPIPANIVFLQNSGMDQVWLVGYKSKVMHLDFSSERWTTFANLSFQCESSPQDQWFVEVSDRVVWQNNGVWTSFGTDDGLMDSPVRLMITSRGQVWAAGSHQGIASTAVFREGKWERQIHSRLSWGIDYRSVFEAKDGSLWFGGSVDAERKDGFLSGLLQLADPMATNLNWVHHPYNENGLKQANVYGIGQSKDGRIWIGGSRLYYFDGKTWQNPPDKRLQQFVNVIYSAGDRLLVGSRYYGLFIFDGEKWENYNTSSGLSGNTIISIDVLPDSTIIVATENDICRFDGSSWTHNIFPEKWNMDFEGGTIAHTSDNAIWISHVPRSWKRRAYHNNREQAKNLAFFSIRYQPDNLPPQTTLDYFQETISPRGNSLISWKGTDFFSHTPAGKLSYSYRIDRGEWSPFSSDDRHTFTSLPGGKHKLEVRTRDQDFNVDSTPAAIEFQVLFPIWRQTWFILLLMAFLTIFAVYEYRVLAKKRKLEILNLSLQKANAELQEKSVKIEAQNMEIRNQRDKLEEMVEQVEKLSKAKLTFFTNISHELRTPLTLIQGPINQLIQEDENLSPQARTRLQEIIRRNAARLLKLISQLLEIRRIEQSALELKPVPVYLSRYIREIAGLFDDLAARRKIGITFSDYTREVLVSVDGDKVEKIITNLLSNAFKHTPEGGEIRINVGLVNSAETHLAVGFDEYFEISVQDNGCGITARNWN